MNGLIVSLLVLLLLGCASDPGVDKPVTDSPNGAEHQWWTARPPASTDKDDTNKAQVTSKATPPKDLRIHGTGVFVKPGSASVGVVPAAGDITLNFEAEDLRGVIKTILSDLLGVNYIIDPAVQGSVTMETGRPLTKELLLPTLETLLRMNKAALLYKDGVYHVVPMASALQGEVTPQLGDTGQALPRGYSVRIVPLQYVGVTEMAKILKPFAPEGSIVRVDPVRNLLVLAGANTVLASLLETINTFDVNWIKGLSVGLFKLQHGKLETVMKQIESITSGQEDNPLAGMFKVVPIEAVNGLLVVTHQAEYLEQIGTWIERLDNIGVGDDSAEPILFVYRVKNGDASSLAQMLGQLFSDGKGAQQGSAPARVAPGMKATSIGTTNTTLSNTTGGTTNSTGTATATNTQTTSGNEQVSYHLESGVSIVADPVNNSILLRATPAQYRQIEVVLEKLDILPLQVLIEATIVEISLSDSLQYGLQWYFTGNKDNYTTRFGLTDNLDIGAKFPNFNWGLIKDASDVRAVLSTFAVDGLVKILSSPSVMVLDNHTAIISVGDKVPTLGSVTNTGTTGTTTSTSLIVGDVNYQDTGITLGVKPKITPGGLVIMEVEQVVSTPAVSTSSTINSPTINNRKINSTVAIKDGQVAVLGGLIRDEKKESQDGLPGLYKHPFWKFLFGRSTQSSSRTELLVILTPKIMREDTDLTRITEEFRSRLQGLKGKF